MFRVIYAATAYMTLIELPVAMYVTGYVPGALCDLVAIGIQLSAILLVYI